MNDVRRGRELNKEVVQTLQEKMGDPPRHICGLPMFVFVVQNRLQPTDVDERWLCQDCDREIFEEMRQISEELGNFS